MGIILTNVEGAKKRREEQLELRKKYLREKEAKASVAFARANGVSEHRIIHNNNELKAFFEGR